MPAGEADEPAQTVARLASLRQHQQGGRYPFTRLRADGVWVLDQDVPMDLVGPLTQRHVTGRFEPTVESWLRGEPSLARSAARGLVNSHFPRSVAPDVLLAVGLDPDRFSAPRTFSPTLKSRRPSDDAIRSGEPRCYRAWDRQCAFCGYDGQPGGATIGVEAAHVRWFAYDGPGAVDNGLALCALHHKLFDLGALDLDAGLRVLVSVIFSARTAAGRAIYDLHGGN